LEIKRYVGEIYLAVFSEPVVGLKFEINNYWDAEKIMP